MTILNKIKWLVVPSILGIAQLGSIVNEAKAETASISGNVPSVSNLSDNSAVDQELSSNSMSQLNSVSSLRDVSPTDWAYEALRSLVERYGCIVGYPDRTFRGNRALSRYEFAAGLNACMQQMERLIAGSESVLKEDVATLQRLAQ